MTQRKPNLQPVRELTPTLHFRTIHGYRRAFRVAGSGPVLLLIHGFPTASWDYAPLWESLAARWRVLTLDMLGFGFSAKPRNYPYSICAQADLVEALKACHQDNIHGYQVKGRDQQQGQVEQVSRPPTPGRTLF